MSDMSSSEIIKEDTKYNLTLIEDTKIVIGGKTEKFVPNINMGKWDDECWLNINHPDVVLLEKETLIGGKIELSIGNNIHKYYIDNDGNLEYEIILKEKPLSNIIELNLDFSEGLEFYKQISLLEQFKLNPRGCNTFTEFEGIAGQPENVLNSYAVYWNKKNNKYKTGKFCHIYRPKLIDVNMVERWAELNIENDKLQIICDFTGLTFPVIVDPILGYDTAGSNTLGLGLAIGNIRTTDGSGGAIESYHCSLAVINEGSPGLKLGCYEVSGGDPSSQALVEFETGVAEVSDDNSMVSSGTPSLSASTEYFIVGLAESNSTTVKYDAGGSSGDYYYKAVTYGDEFSDPAAAGYTPDAALFSIWLVYAVAGGNAPTADLQGPLVGPFGGPIMVTI